MLTTVSQYLELLISSKRERCYMKPNLTMNFCHAGQTYVKLVDRSKDKLYAFYTEENNDQNPDSDMYTPRVSQICKVRGTRVFFF